MKNLPAEVLVNIIELLRSLIYILFLIGLGVFGFFARAVIGKFDKISELMQQVLSLKESLESIKEEQKEQNIRLNQIEKRN